VNYDQVASAYDRRYDLNAYDGVRDYLRRFIDSSADVSVLEVGCGTGHWLAELASDRVS
jgi:ubiquinone/menaquinone biosynthesis C-methylase UbiE